MLVTRPEPAIVKLPARIEPVEGDAERIHEVLPFKVSELDSRLTSGGLVLGGLHEITGGGKGAQEGAASLLFTAGIAARLPGKVLWCVKRRDLFAPEFYRVGLMPERIHYADAGNDRSLLAQMEAGLRDGEFSAVIGEMQRLSLSSSRRLQLAAEESATPCFVLRHLRPDAELADFETDPSAALTKWRISVLPPMPVPTLVRDRDLDPDEEFDDEKPKQVIPASEKSNPRWLVELVQGGTGARSSHRLEACDEDGYLSLPPMPVQKAAPVDRWRRYRSVG